MGHLLKVTKTIGFGATGFRATGFIAIGFRWVFRQVPFSETPAEIEVPKKLVSRSKDLIALPAGSAGRAIGTTWAWEPLAKRGLPEYSVSSYAFVVFSFW